MDSVLGMMEVYELEPPAEFKNVWKRKNTQMC